MYSWLSNTYNDVCLYEKDTFLIWIWCMGLNITHDRFEVAFEFLFFLHFRHNFLILHSMEDWKVWKHLLKTCFEKKTCDATSTRVWSPALYRPSFFVQYPSLLQCDFLFVWNEIDLLPVLLGVVHKRRQNFSWFFDPSFPQIEYIVIWITSLPKKDVAILKFWTPPPQKKSD